MVWRGEWCCEEWREGEKWRVERWRDGEVWRWRRAGSKGGREVVVVEERAGLRFSGVGVGRG